MDKLDFAEGIKILSSCYHKEISNYDFIIWYEMLKDVDAEVFKKSIIDLCKEKSFMPTIHDILDKTKVVKSNYYLSILEQMKRDGYFKLGVQPLPLEQEERNYDKAIRWIEKGIIHGFLKEDMQQYMNKQIDSNDRKYYRSCSICGNIHEEDKMCKRVYKKDTKESHFRNINAWINKRNQIKKEIIIFVNCV